MLNVKYLILGAGPCGLTFAMRLLRAGERSFLVLEKEKEVGGLCRSREVDGAPLDIGGAHCYDPKRERVNRFLFSFLPESEWRCFKSKSCIQMDGFTIGYPFESFLWQIPKELRGEYLDALSRSGCARGEPFPENFIDWIFWKFGDKIAREYMLPYNQKMWSDKLDSLGTQWLYKLPSVSFDEILLSCERQQPLGNRPSHIERSLYPKQGGCGKPFALMAQALGEHIKYGFEVTSLEPDTLTVNDCISAEKIINTLPWDCICGAFDADTRALIAGLSHTSTDIDYYPEEDDYDGSICIYFSDLNKAYSRKLFRRELIPSYHGSFYETNSERRAEISPYFHFVNSYSYPVSSADKPEIMSELLRRMRSCGIYGIGRWGSWEHMNMDAVIEQALELADELEIKE